MALERQFYETFYSMKADEKPHPSRDNIPAYALRKED